MAYATTNTPADGSTDLFQLTFNYLSKDHITVLVDGEPVDFTFADTYTVQITDGPPAAGSIVQVSRNTPIDKRLVDFQDGSVLAETDLDMMNLQLLFVSQEAVDKMVSALIEGGTGQLDALDRQIKNLATPTEAADAATKQYADQTITASQAYALQARNSVDAAAATAQQGINQSVDLVNNYAEDAFQHLQAAKDAQAVAEAARDASLAALDNFDDRYLGPKATDPVTDNDGEPLIGGALYFNTTLDDLGKPLGLRLYDGISWSAAYVSGEGFLQASNALSELIPVAPQVRANLDLVSGEVFSTFAARMNRVARITLNSISR